MVDDKEIGTEGLVMLIKAALEHYAALYGKKTAQQATKEAYREVFMEDNRRG